jgi:hypothetical protein
MTRCWECGRTIPPAVCVRWRYTRTGEGYQHGLAGGRSERYGKVAYCPACDEACTTTEQTMRVQDAKEITCCAGALVMMVYGYTLGIPWSIGLILAGVLAYLRVLWSVILAGVGVAAGFQWLLGRDAAEDPALSLPWYGIAVGLVLITKTVLRHRRHRQPQEAL